MNIWAIAGLILVAGLGYSVGFQHGGDRTKLDWARATAPVEIVVPSPHASVCARILEAAWSVEEAIPTD